MNIFLRELKSSLRSLLIWCFGVMFLVYVGMMKYDGFSKAGESANELFEALPKALKVIMGMNNLDLALISGYYVIFFMYFSLLGAIHASMQGAIVLSKEERDKTADFLMVKPQKRRRVISIKILASLFNLVCLNLVTWLSSLIAIEFYNTGPSINTLVTQLMIALFLLQLVFFSVGFFFGGIFKTKKATNLSTGVLLGTFLLSVIIDLYHKIDFLKFLTPFKYFDGKAIYENGIHIGYVLLSLLIVSVAIGLTYLLYQKRDLHV